MSEQKQLTPQNWRPFVIIWNAHLKTSSLEEAEEVLKQISKAIGYEITTLRCEYYHPKEETLSSNHELTVYKHEQYLQDDTLFKATFLCDLDTYEVSTAIHDAFQVNTQIAEKWEATLPKWIEHFRDEWAFLGKAINPKNSAIEMIEFNLQRKPLTFYRIRDL